MGPGRGVVAVTLSAFLTAAGPSTAARVDCKNAVAQNDMNFCADLAYRAADRQLNAVYRKLSSHLDAREKDLLTRAERAWVAFRDKECTYQSSENEGGSIYPLVYSGCLERLTKDRTQQIDAYVKERSGQ